ncbi:hypothetical protein [Serratia liquefaciens]|nr:hypothetical protein [Serratia liquefaciens]
MLLIDYIDSVYGTVRGNRARFLKDNPDILPQELSRWLKAGLMVRKLNRPFLSFLTMNGGNEDQHVVRPIAR